MPVRPIIYSSQNQVAGISPFIGLEGASETFGAGAVLVEDAAQLDEAAADPTSGIVGIAAQAATGTTGSSIAYYPALEGVVWEGNLSTGGASPPTAYTLTAGDFLTRYALQVDTSQNPDVWYIDQADTGNVSVTIIGFRDPVGTSDGRVYFVINADTTPYAT